MAQISYRVLILGYGEMGHAMVHLLRGRHEIRVWQRRPSAETATVDIDQSTSDSDFVIFCLPAQPLHELARRIAPRLSPETLCLTIAKGLDDTGRTPAEALAAGLNGAPFAVLYGPMISEEIRAGRPAFAQCGVRSPYTFERIHGLFRGTTLHLDQTTDITGLSWSAILKNVYAMGFGMADELGFGDNVRGFLAVVALRELDGIVTQLGGQAATAYNLAGLGDLITTATSTGSHHHELGRLIARGVRDELKGEGVHTLSILRTAGRCNLSSFPLFNLIDNCLRNPDSTRAQLNAFLEQSRVNTSVNFGVRQE